MAIYRVAAFVRTAPTAQDHVGFFVVVAVASADGPPYLFENLRRQVF